MKQTVLCLFVLSLFSACHKDNKIRPLEDDTVVCTPAGPNDYLDNYHFGTVSTDTFVRKYEAMWKEIFMEKNHMTDSAFTRSGDLRQRVLNGEKMIKEAMKVTAPDNGILSL